MKKFWKWLTKKPLTPAIVLCVAVQVGDMISSLAQQPDGVIEQNPFARNGNGQFWLWHGFVVKVMYAVWFGGLSFAIYEAVRRYDRHLAEVLAAIPILYYAVVVAEAVISNLLMSWGYYVDIPAFR